MPPLRIFLLLVAVTLLAAVVQLSALQLAFDKLGLSSGSFLWLLLLILLGSMVNVPLFTIRTQADSPTKIFQQMPERLLRYLSALPGKTIIAVNVGGCIVPVAMSLYLFVNTPLRSTDVALGIGMVTLVAYFGSTLIPGIGVVMPMLAPPLAAALISLTLDTPHAAPLAYICGTLGVLLGADVLRLGEIGKAGEAAVSIGGAGSFDGIFLTGILAVLIA
jgi:uncharacterized membrane protein